MVNLIVLVIVWIPFVISRLLLRAQHARTLTSTPPKHVSNQPPSGLDASTGRQDEPTWSALDDRQLTRLLTDSAPRNNTE